MPHKLNRITYVEDEPDIRAVAVLTLERLGGFVVDPCRNGPEALERAPLFQPDFILLDFMMPEMNGEETLSRMKEIPELANIPVAFMTARAQTSELEHYFSVGANGVIPKPFDPIMLPHRLHSIWRNYHQH